MYGWLLAIGCAVFTYYAEAKETYLVEGPYEGPAHITLRIYGAANFDAIEPVFKRFVETHRHRSILYTEYGTKGLYEHLSIDQDWPDVVMSPAMNYQVKLVNDGYASPNSNIETSLLPDWAHWRDEVFGFTYEPIAIAINRKIVGEGAKPSNRDEVLQLIRQAPDKFYGKVGLLDMKTVGLGYLTWAHDSEQSRLYGRLLEVYGASSARVYPNSSAMLKALSEGDIYIAHNVLGSYALAWADQHSQLDVIFPSEYTSVISRSAFVPKKAERIREGHEFVEFLLSPLGQKVLADASSLIPLLLSETTGDQVSLLRLSRTSPFQPISLNLPLILLTDYAKQMLLFKEWNNALEQ
ncbi:MAG: ABC transporter substrate-binding protein [Pontibacterium sp.]